MYAQLSTGLAVDPLCMASGVEVEAVLIVESVRVSGGGLCFFSLAAGEGLKGGRGAGSHVACGTGPGLFSFSSLYSFWKGWYFLA